MGKIRIQSTYEAQVSEVKTQSVVVPTFNFGEPKQEVLIAQLQEMTKTYPYPAQETPLPQIQIEYRDVQVPVETIKYIDRVVEKLVEVPVERVVEKLVEIEKIVEMERIIEVESKELQELVQLQCSQLQKLEAQMSAKLNEITKLKYILGVLVIIAIIGVLV